MISWRGAAFRRVRDAAALLACCRLASPILAAVRHAADLLAHGMVRRVRFAGREESVTHVSGLERVGCGDGSAHFRLKQAEKCRFCLTVLGGFSGRLARTPPAGAPAVRAALLHDVRRHHGRGRRAGCQDAACSQLDANGEVRKTPVIVRV